MSICASCGHETDASFPFCPACGTPLADVRSVRRKLATVLSCDISGSTAMGERLDAESVRELMLSYFHTMRSVLEHHGGTVEKFIGDAVVAVFGVPTAHEDDALRACRAATEMRARLEELNQDLERGFGDRLAFRIGVHTSEVVASDASTRQTFVTGDAANVAARLEQAAEPGEILIGEVTRELARAAVEVEPVAPIVAKGKAEPVVAYRLLAVSQGPAPQRPAEAPLVGREEEMADLERRFEQLSPSAAACLQPSSVNPASANLAWPPSSPRGSRPEPASSPAAASPTAKESLTGRWACSIHAGGIASSIKRWIPGTRASSRGRYPPTVARSGRSPHS